MISHLPLKTRLWILGVVSVMGVAILALSSIWHAQHSKVMLRDFVEVNIALNRSATAAYADGLQIGQALRNILLDPSNKKAFENLTAANSAFTAETGKLTSLLSKNGDGGEIARRLKENIDLLLPLQKQIVELISSGNGTAAKELLVAKETPAWRAVRSDLLDLVKRSEASAETDRISLLNGLDDSRTLAIALSIASFLLVAVITVFVARGIFQQVGGEPAYAAMSLQHIAQGDLTHQLAVRPGDTASVVAAMNSMQSQIHQLIAGTVSSAESVVKESEAMQADAARLSETAQEQSSAASAIAAAVEQLTVSIGAMSENANEAGQLSTQSEIQAHNGLSIVSAATGTIQRVADGMANASVTMEELSRKVTDINGIVQTIREIADQTNLLALNAAIEAARAGEQGRGFAVVADEVRKLAELTRKSTQEISEIVDGVRLTTDTALETMSRAKGLALEGATQTENVRNAVLVMDESSIEVSKAIGAIADSLREQTSASNDIARRIEMIAQGIEHTHAASSASSRRSRVLVDLSHALKDSVRRFRV